MTMTTLPGGVLLVNTNAPDLASLPACRAALLDTRRHGQPAALIACLPADVGEDARLAVCELMQYVDLCVIDRASAALIGVENEKTHPDLAAALVRKLIKRFALGGVVLPEEGYARLDSPTAQRIYPAITAWFNKSKK